MAGLDYLGLKFFIQRLDADYQSYSITLDKSLAVETWIADQNLHVVRIIDPVPEGMHSLNHLFGQKGVTWLSFDHAKNIDIWYFHPEDADVQMLFKLTWMGK